MSLAALLLLNIVRYIKIKKPCFRMAYDLIKYLLTLLSRGNSYTSCRFRRGMDRFGQSWGQP